MEKRRETVVNCLATSDGGRNDECCLSVVHFLAVTHTDYAVIYFLFKFDKEKVLRITIQSKSS